MIGAFALFDLGLGSATLFAAVLTYRLIAFWLPLVPDHRLLPAPHDGAALGARAPGPRVGSEIAESLPGATITRK